MRSIRDSHARLEQKAPISLVLCANATGNDRLDIWIIGKAKTPRALKNINVARWNKKAWMNTTVMVEWLQAFYLHIGSTMRLINNGQLLSTLHSVGISTSTYKYTNLLAAYKFNKSIPASGSRNYSVI
jgi:hypothetical protein